METAEKISVTVTAEQLREIRRSVEEGQYASVSEVVRAALRLLAQQRREDEQRLEAIRARIRRSIEDPRPALSSEAVEERLERVFAELDEDA
jgi:antitoxin ParD1/3/4